MYRNLLFFLNFILLERIDILLKLVLRKRKLKNKLEELILIEFVKLDIDSDEDMDFLYDVIYVFYIVVEKILGEDVGDLDVGDIVEFVYELYIVEEDFLYDVDVDVDVEEDEE